MGGFMRFDVKICLVLTLVRLTTGHWIRLRDGQTRFEGRLEVRYMGLGLWGTICDHDFDIQDGAVACRQLGFQGVHAIHHGNYFRPTTAVPRWIWLRNLRCDGEEDDLNDCDGDPWRSYGGSGGECSHEQDAGVECNACGDPGVPAGGRLLGNDRSLGSEVRYLCDKGVLEGSGERRCQEDGSWTGNLPKCVSSDLPTSCGDPGDPINGYQTSADNTIGANKTYSCVEGYSMVSVSWRICQVDGEWSGSEPRCEMQQVTTPGIAAVEETTDFVTRFLNPAIGLDAQSSEKQTNGPSKVLIGVCVAGVILLIIAAILVVIVIFKKRKAGSRNHGKDAEYKVRHISNEAYIDVGIIEHARHRGGGDQGVADQGAATATTPGDFNANEESIYEEIGEHGLSVTGATDTGYQPITGQEPNNYTPLRSESRVSSAGAAAMATDVDVDDLKSKSKEDRSMRNENLYEGLP